MAIVYYKGHRLPKCSPAVARKLLRPGCATELYPDKTAGVFVIGIDSEAGLKLYCSSFTRDSRVRGRSNRK